MTLKQFEYLSQQDQEFIINTQAVHLISLVEGNKLYNLFQVDGFYLELNSVRNGKYYTSATFFDDMSMLEPYLEFININEINGILE